MNGTIFATRAVGMVMMNWLTQAIACDLQTHRERGGGREME